MLRRLSLFALLASCAPAVAERPPTPGAHLRVLERAALPDTLPGGLSGLTRDPRGRLWAVPERERALLVLTSTGGHIAVSGAPLPIVGAPDGLDLESIAWLEGQRLAFGTESRTSDRESDPLLYARVQAGRVVIEGRFELPYAPFDLRAPSNAGIEGLCASGGVILAAAELTGMSGRRRFAPLWVADGRGAVVRTARLLLTSKTGKVSALSCTRDAKRLEVMAIERHYEVTRLLRFDLPLDPTAPQEIEPSWIADLTPLLPEHPNLEGLVAAADGEVLIVSDNSSRGAGPSVVLRLSTRSD